MIDHTTIFEKINFQLYYMGFRTLKSEYSRIYVSEKKNIFEIPWPRAINWNFMKPVLENKKNAAPYCKLYNARAAPSHILKNILLTPLRHPFESEVA